MKKQRIQPFVLAGVVLVLGAVATSPSSGCRAQRQVEGAGSSQLSPAELGGMRPLHAFDGILLAGQPSAADLEDAARAGVKTVVNLRQERELGSRSLEGEVRALGLAYESIPFRGADELTAEVFDRVRAVLESAERPLLLHCSTANRVGAVWIPWRVLDGGVELDAAIAEARVIGLTTDAYEALAREYVERHRSGP